jgi:predicted enzyme related to lactoylglutathione lyase
MSRPRSVAALLLAALTVTLAPSMSTAAPRAVIAVGPQYDTTHVYVAPADFDPFVASLLATFGGSSSKKGAFTVTPTPSLTFSQLVLTPAGTLSVFGFQTPVPYPFGAERTGYLVKDLDQAVAAARRAGATVVVQPFPDPIGRDVVIQWPGGVTMQLYWHTAKPSYTALLDHPENRVYLGVDSADTFMRDWLRFSKGRVVSDNRRADGGQIGEPARAIRRIDIESGFGRLVIFATDGHLPWPFGREITGYEVPDLDATLASAAKAGVDLIAGPTRTGDRRNAMVRFPGGYIAEIHSAAGD